MKFYKAVRIYNNSKVYTYRDKKTILKGNHKIGDIVKLSNGYYLIEEER
jgi:hypothetical protein